MSKKIPYPTVIGVTEEGSNLLFAILQQRNENIDIIQVKSVPVAKSDKKGEEEDLSLDHLDGVFSLEQDTEASEAANDEPKPVRASDLSAYVHLLNMVEGVNCQLAISMEEPNVFYQFYPTNWGLSGEKLARKVKSESEVHRSAQQPDSLDAIRTLELDGGRVMAVCRDKNLPLLQNLEAAKRFIHGQIPRINFVESAEISLINLFLEYNHPEPEELTVLVHVGEQHSRMIFLLGREIHALSPIIGEGYQSRTIAATVANRMEYMLDTHSLAQPARIIISGMRNPINVMHYLRNQFPRYVKIEPLSLKYLNTNSLDKKEAKELGRYAVPIGAALRALHTKPNGFYRLDLTPQTVKEKQNRLSLPIVGWLMMAAIPVLLAFILWRIGEFTSEMKSLRTDLIPLRTQVAQIENLDSRADSLKSIVAQYEKTIALTDSLHQTSHRYSGFIDKAMREIERIRGIWLTELSSDAKGRLMLSGTALSLDKIPEFLEAVGQGTVERVEKQDIRGRTVVLFQVSFPNPDKWNEVNR